MGRRVSGSRKGGGAGSARLWAAPLSQPSGPRLHQPAPPVCGASSQHPRGITPKFLLPGAKEGQQEGGPWDGALWGLESSFPHLRKKWHLSPSKFCYGDLPLDGAWTGLCPPLAPGLLKSPFVCEDAPNFPSPALRSISGEGDSEARGDGHVQPRVCVSGCCNAPSEMVTPRCPFETPSARLIIGLIFSR